MLATTKQVRALVHSLCTVYKGSYTDVSASKRKSKIKDNLRNITFCAQYSTTQQDAERLRAAMFMLGYTNKIKVTLGKYSYLRINNCILEG
jgi:hypothetical protein